MKGWSDTPWTLSVVGDGPGRAEVISEFAGLPEKRIEWLGKKEPDEIPELLAGGGIYVWPGCGEAYGLAYLEAQAAGLPVIAQDTAGVPEVVRNGQTGILTPPGDVEAFASAIAHLLADDDRRRAMGETARRFVFEERSLEAAAAKLDDNASSRDGCSMNPDPDWQPLLAELGRWGAAGRTADFWLRDDDAVEPGEALDRLLGLTEEFAVPLALAVIPAFTGEALASRLADAKHVTVAVHGWSHENHAPDGEKKQELGRHRDRAVVVDELRRGLSRIGQLHGQRMVPLLVPPWNRIDAGLVPDLAPIGFAALSAFGPARPAAIRVINSNVDLMDWHGTRGCRDHALLVGDIVLQLRTGF